MTTVVSRTFRSTPQRDAIQTWLAIVDLLTAGKSGPNRTELLAVQGTAASVIADQAPKDAAIIVTCDGPRTRIYCTYDDNAIDGDGSNENSLGFDALAGDWRISLPCAAEDLEWVQRALKGSSTRISARVQSETTKADGEQQNALAGPLVFDRKGFLGS
jgi:hypothetical protein